MKRWLVVRITLGILCIIILVGLGVLIRLGNVKVIQISGKSIGVAVAALASVMVALVSTWLPIHMQNNKTTKDLKQQHKERYDEVTKSVKAIKGHAQVYRKSIHVDPRVATMQILDMTRPLDVTAIYVRLRVNDDP